MSPERTQLRESELSLFFLDPESNITTNYCAWPWDVFSTELYWWPLPDTDDRAAGGSCDVAQCAWPRPFSTSADRSSPYSSRSCAPPRRYYRTTWTPLLRQAL